MPPFMKLQCLYVQYWSSLDAGNCENEGIFFWNWQGTNPLLRNFAALLLFHVLWPPFSPPSLFMNKVTVLRGFYNKYSNSIPIYPSCSFSDTHALT